MAPLVVTAAIVEDRGKILVTRRPDHVRHGGLWEFPGGKLEDGESPEEALHRELIEELDLPVSVGAIFDVVYHRYDWGAVLLLAYRCRPHHLRLRNLEVAEHRWLPPAGLAALPFLPADRPLLERLAAEAADSQVAIDNP